MTARFLEQRTVDPADLDPYPGNPNIGDVDAIRASLRANGQYRAPVARLMPDGRLQVLAGHAPRSALSPGCRPKVYRQPSDQRKDNATPAVDTPPKRRRP